MRLEGAATIVLSRPQFPFFHLLDVKQNSTAISDLIPRMSTLIHPRPFRVNQIALGRIMFQLGRPCMVCRGRANQATGAKLAEKCASRTSMKLLSVNEHRELCTNAGYSDVQVIEERDKGWICCVGRKPIAKSCKHRSSSAA
jgi:hypothetical protein